MRKIYPILIAGALMMLSIFGAHTANALSSYQSTYNTNYGAHTSGCTLCHPGGDTSRFTAAGSAFGPSHNYAAIAPNPQVTGFTIPATSASLTVPITTFTATDNPLSPLSPITGYMVTESATPPSYNAAGWSATAPTSYTFATAGTKTLYAWALDYVYVVSASRSASTTITLPSPPPVINSFTATPGSITSGQSSTLAWTLSGGAPTALSINNGVGSVLGSTSRSVTPSATTTYTLSASNSGGSVQALVTVTVSSSSPPPPSPGQLPHFSRSSTRITNLYFPLAGFEEHVLEGTIGGQAVRVERTLRSRAKSFKVGRQRVRTLIMEDRSFVNGELEEVTLDYFGQADDGTVYYFGEDVNIYSNGAVVSHEGAWRYGVNTNQLGILMPANPQVGTTFQAENVPGITVEDNEIVSVSETVTVPAGTFTNCVKIQESLSDGTIEYKYYAPNVGLVKEVSPDGELNLISIGFQEAD